MQPRNSQPSPPPQSVTFRKSQIGGFTLIEVIVSIGIFAMAVTMALVGLLEVIDASRQSRAQVDSVDNLNFVVDDMIRRIRVGYGFACEGSGDCVDGGDEFSFRSSEVGEDADDNPQITYELVSGPGGVGQIERTIQGQGGPTVMTSPDIDVTNLTFYVTGAEDDDGEQSRVMILIEAQAGDPEVLDTFSLQTTVTQRLLFNP